MKAVIYFSCTGASEKIARELAEKLNFTPSELTPESKPEILRTQYCDAVVVFPVHCQTYPSFMKDFFGSLTAERVSLIATYGRANAGNAIYEAAKKLRAPLVAAAYMPAEHSYVADGFVSPRVPDELAAKILSGEPAEPLPKRRKTSFAGLFPSLRSRTLVKIIRTDDCTGCGECEKICPMRSVKKGTPDGKCVRCLKCVKNCPHGALKVKKARILQKYLSKADKSEVILYL